MTSPVHMDLEESEASMSFVMPSEYPLSDLPKPDNPGIILHQTEDEYVAAIQFGGYATDKDIEFYSEKLLNSLKKKGIIITGNVRYFGYNPPYQVYNRRNEVIVPVKWNE